MAQSESTVVWERTCLMLSNHELGVLGQFAGAIRHNCGVSLNRSELVRGLVDGVLLSGLALERCGSETAIRELIRGRLNGNG